MWRMPAAQADAVQEMMSTETWLPGGAAGQCPTGWVTTVATSPLPPAGDRRPLARRRRADVVALHVAHDPDEPPEVAGDRRTDAPPAAARRPRPRRTSRRPRDGVGPLFHRRYAVRIAGARALARRARRAAARDLDAFAPSEFASFQRVVGDGQAAARATSTSCACPARGTGPCASCETDRRLVPARHADRAPRGRADRVPRRRGRRRAARSRSSRGRAAATGSRISSTRTCGWPRRSSCTCGSRSSSA